MRKERKKERKMKTISEESTLGVWSNENWKDKDQWKKINLTATVTAAGSVLGTVMRRFEVFKKPMDKGHFREECPKEVMGRTMW